MKKMLALVLLLGMAACNDKAPSGGSGTGSGDLFANAPTVGDFNPIAAFVTTPLDSTIPWPTDSFDPLPTGITDLGSAGAYSGLVAKKDIYPEDPTIGIGTICSTQVEYTNACNPIVPKIDNQGRYRGFSQICYQCLPGEVTDTWQQWLTTDNQYNYRTVIREDAPAYLGQAPNQYNQFENIFTYHEWDDNGNPTENSSIYYLYTYGRQFTYQGVNVQRCLEEMTGIDTVVGVGSRTYTQYKTDLLSRLGPDNVMNIVVNWTTNFNDGNLGNSNNNYQLNFTRTPPAQGNWNLVSAAGLPQFALSGNYTSLVNGSSVNPLGVSVTLGVVPTFDGYSDLIPFSNYLSSADVELDQGSIGLPRDGEIIDFLQTVYQALATAFGG